MRRRLLRHPNYIIATYDILKTDSPTQILGYNQSDTSVTYDFNQIDSIEICGDVITPRTHYTFPILGKVTVRYNFSKDFNSMYNLFRNCTQFVEVDLRHFNTHNCTNMRAAFHYCTSLNSFIMGEDFTTKYVTDMGYMFHNCTSLTSTVLEPFISTFDTSSCTKMDAMFYSCSKLNKLTFDTYPLWDTSKVVDMHYMFADMASMGSYDWQTGLGLKINTDNGTSALNTSSLVTCYGMFTENANKAFTYMNLQMDLSKVTDMRYLFSGCNYISGIRMKSALNSKLTADGVAGMFYELPTSGTFTYNKNEPKYQSLIIPELKSGWTKVGE